MPVAQQNSLSTGDVVEGVPDSHELSGKKSTDLT